MTHTTPSILPVADRRTVLAVVRPLLRRHRGALILALLGLILAGICGLAGPVSLGWITQLIADGAAPTSLVGPGLLLLVAGLGQAGFGWIATVALSRGIQPGVATLREDTVSAALNLPLARIEAGGTGDLVSRVSGDAEEVSDAASWAFIAFAGAGITIIMTLLGLAALDWRFALAGALAIPIQGFALRRYLRASGPIFAAGRAADGVRAGTLLTAFSALPTVRALRLGEREYTRIDTASRASMGWEFRAVRTATVFYARLNAAEWVGLSAILIAGYLLVTTGTVPLGAAVTAALFFAGLFDPINTVLGVFGVLQRAGAGLARLVGVLDSAGADPDAATSRSASRSVSRPASRPVSSEFSSRPTSISASQTSSRSISPAREPEPEPRAEAAVGLAARNLVFGYHPGVPLLDGLNLEVAPGEHVAIVGESGSGKSTLAAVIAGLRDVDAGFAGPVHGTGVVGGDLSSGSSGVDALDGDGNGLDGDQRGLPLAIPVPLATQEGHVFAGTIAENLAIAKPDSPARALTAALDLVGARDWVDALPEGIHTRVGGGGLSLTAERSQHLALARIALLDPPAVILDEATAEAGSDAARTLDAAAEALLRGRTALIIAHRLDQAARADRIIVMEHGRIIESGTHAELRAARGRYAHLWAAWASTAD
ncbi:ABC transporter ATP-binding protein [Mycetocola saprophilus]|uniref:ABC transporter ATP-binding protein n=1 Tax=Mycetocola saprophilus TaxID=76636 RepID=UPI0004C13E47|nr:ABC transporter ATP-binding protein [Mycetocola saprophilus]